MLDTLAVIDSYRDLNTGLAELTAATWVLCGSGPCLDVVQALEPRLFSDEFLSSPAGVDVYETIGSLNELSDP